MERKRKSFCYLTTKVYQGEKTLGIRFEPKQDKEVIIKMVSTLFFSQFWPKQKVEKLIEK